jgi:hypothetical protein
MQRLTADDLFKPEDNRPRHMTSQQWNAEQRTGVTREQAMADMAELF